VSGCSEATVRAWCANTGACAAAARLPAGGGALQTLAACCSDAGTLRVAAACATALYLLHGDTLEVTRVLSGGALPRSPLLALRCAAAPALDDQHAPRRAGGSSGALSALASVRAEEEELLLAGVDAAGGAWRWRGDAAGNVAQQQRAEPPTPLALLGWTRPVGGDDGGSSDEEEEAPKARPLPRGAPACAALSADGGEALLVSPSGWAIVPTARPAPGALPSPARASGEGAFAGGAFLGPAARCVALWTAAGELQVLDLPEPAVAGRGRALPPRVLLRASAVSAAASQQRFSVCCLEAPDGSRLVVRAGGAPAALCSWTLSAGLPPSPAMRSELAAGWPQRDGGATASTSAAVTACAFAGGGALSPCWLVQGHADGGIALRPLPPGGDSHAWLRGHAGAVRCLAACRACGSAVLLSGGDDATVRAWLPAAGTPLAVLRHHVAPVLSLHVVRASMVPAAPATPGREGDEDAACDAIVVSEADDGALGVISLPAGAGTPRCERLLADSAASGQRCSTVAWVEASGSLIVARKGGGGAAWDALTGIRDRVLAGAAAEELAEAAGPRDTAPLQALRGHPAAPWASLLAVDVAALLSRRGGGASAGEAWGPPSSNSGELSEEERALRCALAALHAWGVDARLDAQLAAECGGGDMIFAPALCGAEGGCTLLTPAGAASHELLRASPRFVAARSLAMAALARRLQRLGERGRSCAAAVLAFYTVQLTGALATAPPALAVYAAAWQDANEYIREAARALLASAPAAAVPAALRKGGDASWRVIEAAAGGPPADSPACTGRLGVLVAAGVAVASLRREASELIAPSVLPRVVTALRSLLRESPAPHGAAATALLAEGMAAWWASSLGDGERGALAEDGFELVERLSAQGAPGGATELMVAREAAAELLAELAAHAPLLFLASLAGRFGSGAPDSAAHMTCFLALIRVVQTQPAVLAPHLDRVLDTVCAALAPTGGGGRRGCATGAVGVVAELATHLATCVAHHRGSGRVAVAVRVAGRVSFRVYDLGAHCGLLRVLDGAPDEEALERAGDAGAVLSFDADGGRFAAYHPATGALRFWVLGAGGAGWRAARGQPPARFCRVANAATALALKARGSKPLLRLDWVLGISAGVALLNAEDGARLCFLPVIGA
jgi:hypothetical protein